MISKIIFSGLLLISGLKLAAQDNIILDSLHGVIISYKLTRIEQGKKKDTYLVVVKADNINDHDVFYEVSKVKDKPEGPYYYPLLQNLSFAEILIRNSTGSLVTIVGLTANNTQYITVVDNGRAATLGLFSLPKKVSIVVEKKVKVKKGTYPAITHKYLKHFKRLRYFQLRADSQ